MLYCLRVSMRWVMRNTSALILQAELRPRRTENKAVVLSTQRWTTTRRCRDSSLHGISASVSLMLRSSSSLIDRLRGQRDLNLPQVMWLRCAVPQKRTAPQPERLASVYRVQTSSLWRWMKGRWGLFNCRCWVHLNSNCDADGHKQTRVDMEGHLEHVRRKNLYT